MSTRQDARPWSRARPRRLEVAVRPRPTVPSVPKGVGLARRVFLGAMPLVVGAGRPFVPSVIPMEVHKRPLTPEVSVTCHTTRAILAHSAAPLAVVGTTEQVATMTETPRRPPAPSFTCVRRHSTCSSRPLACVRPP